MKKNIISAGICWLILSGTVVDAQNSTSPPTTAISAKVWVQTFNTFDATANNIVLTLQSGEWVQTISYIRKLEISGPILRFTYGKDSRRQYRGVVDASAIKMLTETAIPK